MSQAGNDNESCPTRSGISSPNIYGDILSGCLFFIFHLRGHENASFRGWNCHFALRIHKNASFRGWSCHITPHVHKKALFRGWSCHFALRIHKNASVSRAESLYCDKCAICLRWARMVTHSARHLADRRITCTARTLNLRLSCR